MKRNQFQSPSSIYVIKDTCVYWNPAKYHCVYLFSLPWQNDIDNGHFILELQSQDQHGVWFNASEVMFSWLANINPLIVSPCSREIVSLLMRRIISSISGLFSWSHLNLIILRPKFRYHYLSFRDSIIALEKEYISN